MKNSLIKFAILSLLCLSLAYSFEVSDRWNHRFEKETILNCSESEYFCDDLCGMKFKCVVKERVCRDCIGSSVYLTHIFDQIGRSIINSDETQIDDLLELLKTGRFNSISAKSVYNIMDGVADTDLLRRFKSLCPSEEFQNPIMIFEVEDVSMRLGRPKFLVCNQGENSRIFQVDFTGGIQVFDNP
jgi:hypothetical protein